MNNKVTLNYVRYVYDLDPNKYENSAIIFCEENKNIYIKFNDKLELYAIDATNNGDVPTDDIPYIRINNKWDKLIENFDYTLIPMPLTPSIISPTNNSMVSSILRVDGTKYKHSFGLAMGSKQIQISTVKDFSSNIVYDKTEDSTSEHFNISLNETDKLYLEYNTTYYIRIRYADIRGVFSNWSKSIKVNTEEISYNDAYLVTPYILHPSENGNVAKIFPMFIATAPQILKGSALFTSSHWQIAKNNTFADDDIVFECSDCVTLEKIICSRENNEKNKLTEIDYINEFGKDAKLYVRMRYNTKLHGSTEWSPTVKFGFEKKKYEKNVFGFRRILNSRHTPNDSTIYNIDDAGHIIQLPAEYFDNHPLYKMKTVRLNLCYWKSDYSIDSAEAYSKDYMDFIVMPKCWMKYKVYSDDHRNLIIDEWFTTEDPGNASEWKLHPAFKDNTVSEIYISKNLCSQYNLRTINGPNVNVLGNWGMTNTNYWTASAVESLIANTKAQFNTKVGKLYYGTPDLFNIFHNMLMNDLICARYRNYNAETNPFYNYGHPNNNTSAEAGLYFKGCYYKTEKVQETETYIDPITELELTKTYSYNELKYQHVMNPNNEKDINFEIKGMRNPIDGSRRATRYFKVNSIETGEHDYLGFDIALLMLPNSYVEVTDEEDTGVSYTMGFPYKVYGYYNDIGNQNYHQFNSTTRAGASLMPLFYNEQNIIYTDRHNARLVLYRRPADAVPEPDPEPPIVVGPDDPAPIGPITPDSDADPSILDDIIYLKPGQSWTCPKGITQIYLDACSRGEEYSNTYNDMFVYPCRTSGELFMNVPNNTKDFSARSLKNIPFKSYYMGTDFIPADLSSIMCFGLSKEHMKAYYKDKFYSDAAINTLRPLDNDYVKGQYHYTLWNEHYIGRWGFGMRCRGRPGKIGNTTIVSVTPGDRYIFQENVNTGEVTLTDIDTNRIAYKLRGHSIFDGKMNIAFAAGGSSNTNNQSSTNNLISVSPGSYFPLELVFNSEYHYFTKATTLTNDNQFPILMRSLRNGNGPIIDQNTGRGCGYELKYKNQSTLRSFIAYLIYINMKNAFFINQKYTIVEINGADAYLPDSMKYLDKKTLDHIKSYVRYLQLHGVEPMHLHSIMGIFCKLNNVNQYNYISFTEVLRAIDSADGFSVPLSKSIFKNELEFTWYTGESGACVIRYR